MSRCTLRASCTVLRHTEPWSALLLFAVYTTPWNDAGGHSSVYMDRHTPGEACNTITGLAGFKLEVGAPPPADARGRRGPWHALRNKNELVGFLFLLLAVSSFTVGPSRPNPSNPSPTQPQTHPLPSTLQPNPSGNIRVRYSCNTLAKGPTGAAVRYTTPANDWGWGSAGELS
jgi:hypothetical protein